MVSKQEKIKDAEAVLKELSLLLPTQGDVSIDSFSSEDRDRFYTLASKYASFKQDPALDGVLSGLEDKYNIPAGFRTRVEDYAQRRMELVESDRKDEINDREQQIAQDRRDGIAYQQALEGEARVLTYEEAKKFADEFQSNLANLEQYQSDMQKQDAEVLRFAKKDTQHLEIAVGYLAVSDDKRSFETLSKSLTPEQRRQAERFWEDQKKRVENNTSIFVLNSDGKPVLRRGATTSDGSLVTTVLRNDPQALEHMHQHRDSVRRFYFYSSRVNRDLASYCMTMEQGRLTDEQRNSLGVPKLTQDQLNFLDSGTRTMYERVFGLPRGTGPRTRSIAVHGRSAQTRRQVSDGRGGSANQRVDARTDANRGKPSEPAVNQAEIVEADRNARPTDAPEVVSLRNAKKDKALEKDRVDVAKKVAGAAEENITNPTPDATTQREATEPINRTAQEPRTSGGASR